MENAPTPVASARLAIMQFREAVNNIAVSIAQPPVP
jgi:hypothetical protein